jgi:hypothetical protein
MIVLSWHMKAVEMGYYQKDEFMNGLKELNCDGPEKLKARIPVLRDELKDSNKLREIYKFAWQFAKDDAEKKTICALFSFLRVLIWSGAHSHL